MVLEIGFYGRSVAPESRKNLFSAHWLSRSVPDQQLFCLRRVIRYRTYSEINNVHKLRDFLGQAFPNAF